jgi:hypothetical protein
MTPAENAYVSVYMRSVINFCTIVWNVVGCNAGSRKQAVVRGAKCHVRRQQK